MNSYQERIRWQIWEREQGELLKIEICNQLLKKQQTCGRLCQTCTEGCQEFKEWESSGK